MTETESVTDSTDKQNELTDLEIVQNFSVNLQKIPLSERDSFALAKLLAETAKCRHCLILKHDIENASLEYASIYPKAIGAPPKIYINTFNVDADSIIDKLVSGEIVVYETIPDDAREFCFSC